jgi:hypothetical protein
VLLATQSLLLAMLQVFVATRSALSITPCVSLATRTEHAAKLHARPEHRSALPSHPMKAREGRCVLATVT